MLPRFQEREREIQRELQGEEKRDWEKKRVSERLVAAVLLSRVSFSYQTAHTGYNLKMGGGGHLGSIGWCCQLQPSSVCMSVCLSLSLCHPILEASTSHLCRQGWIALCPSPSARPASTSFVSFVLSFRSFVSFFLSFVRSFVCLSFVGRQSQARAFVRRGVRPNRRWG